MSDGPDSRYSAEVHQAAGVVSIQADCALEDAYVLMSHQADASKVTLDAISAAVLDGSIRFSD